MITEFSKLVRIPASDILGRSRKDRINDARQVYWLLLYENGFNYTEIARLNERTHATVLSGICRVKMLLQSRDKEITGIYELVKYLKR